MSLTSLQRKTSPAIVCRPGVFISGLTSDRQLSQNPAGSFLHICTHTVLLAGLVPPHSSQFECKIKLDTFDSPVFFNQLGSNQITRYCLPSHRCSQQLSERCEKTKSLLFFFFLLSPLILLRIPLWPQSPDLMNEVFSQGCQSVQLRNTEPVRRSGRTPPCLHIYPHTVKHGGPAR